MGPSVDQEQGSGAVSTGDEIGFTILVDIDLTPALDTNRTQAVQSVAEHRNARRGV